MITRRRILIISAGAVIGLAGSGRVLADSPQLTSLPVDHESKPATPTPQGEAQEIDVRDVLAREWKYEGVTVTFQGTIKEMRVAPPGKGFEVGTDGDLAAFRTQMLVFANFDDGKFETVLIAFDDDPVDLHQDDKIAIVGTYGGWHHEEAEGGGHWEWIYFVASSVTLAPEDSEAA